MKDEDSSELWQDSEVAFKNILQITDASGNFSSL